MPPLKKSINQSGLSLDQKEAISLSDPKLSLSNSGIGGNNMLEGVPQYISSPCEEVISNKSNAWIVLGRDRIGSRLSGYGGKGDSHCASIDLVAGRMGYEARKTNIKDQQLHVDPDFKKDAARIYMSQKTDIDKAFDLVPGAVGISKAKSGIGIKADAVRIVAREGIKLVTGTDLKNSGGGALMSISGIDLIAGNNDKELQPMVKGDNLVNTLKDIVTQLDKLAGIVDAFLMSQMTLNAALTTHFHNSPFFGAPTTPSIVVVPIGIKTQIEMLTLVKTSLVAFKTNLAGLRMNALSQPGKNFICSRYNNTN